MPELIQIKINAQDKQKIKTPSLKRALGTSEIRIQESNKERQAKDLIGPGNKLHVVEISPSVLLTISGETLATRKEIIRTLNKHGIRVINSSDKISW